MNPVNERCKKIVHAPGGDHVPSARVNDFDHRIEVSGEISRLIHARM
jgi:hypothetical protein